MALTFNDAHGPEVPTIHDVLLSVDNEREVWPVMNEVDPPVAVVEGAIAELEEVVDIRGDHLVPVVAATVESYAVVLKGMVQHTPGPEDSIDLPVCALAFVATLDPYPSVISFNRVFDGCIGRGDEVMVCSTGKRS